MNFMVDPVIIERVNDPIALGDHMLGILALALLRLSAFEKLNVAQGVCRGDATDGAHAVAGVCHLPVSVQNKIRGVKDFAPLLPVGTDSIRITWDFESVDDRKGDLVLIHGLLGFVQRIDGKGNDVNVFFLKFFEVCLVIG